MNKALSWILIISVFALALTVNTSKINSTYWVQTNISEYEEATQSYDYTVDVPIYDWHDVQALYNVDGYANGTVIKLVTGDQTLYYRAAKVSFIDFGRWENLIFWIQIGVNTLAVVVLYAMTLNNRLEVNLNIAENEELGKQYTQLNEHKNKIISENKKEELNIYLNVHTNLVEKVENFIYKLDKKIKRRRLFKFKARKLIRLKEEYDKYLSALQLLDFNKMQQYAVDIASLPDVRKVNFDTIFDMVDYRTSKPIKVHYSVQHAKAVKIMKAPLSAFGTIFIAVVAFTNFFVFGTDIRSMLLITVMLIIAVVRKINAAISDSNGIAENKLRSIEKGNMVITSFFKVTSNQLQIMKDIVLNETHAHENPEKDIAEKVIEKEDKLELPESMKKMPDKEPELESENRTPLEACKQMLNGI